MRDFGLRNPADTLAIRRVQAGASTFSADRCQLDLAPTQPAISAIT
jgi:hypothetical protein